MDAELSKEERDVRRRGPVQVRARATVRADRGEPRAAGVGRTRVPSPPRWRAPRVKRDEGGVARLEILEAPVLEAAGVVTRAGLKPDPAWWGWDDLRRPRACLESEPQVLPGPRSAPAAGAGVRGS